MEVFLQKFLKMSKKTLIIYDSLDFFIPFMDNENIDVYRLYKKKGRFLTVLKKIFIKKDIFYKDWYGEWINKISNYHTIIIFATTDYSFIKYIKNRFPNIRLIFWYWNPAFRMGLPKKELFSLAEIWSFDLKDCEKYNLKFNTTFYFKDIELKSNNDQNKIDILFLGINKGRRDYLESLEETIKNNTKLNTYFYIVPDKKEVVHESIKPIPYKDYLELVCQTKCILDIMPIGQSGLTLRPMESIFFKKKLITNDLNILNEDFYHKDNIFILGIDNVENLKTFIDLPYVDIDPNIVNKYDFTNWLKRF